MLGADAASRLVSALFSAVPLLLALESTFAFTSALPLPLAAESTFALTSALASLLALESTSALTSALASLLALESTFALTSALPLPLALESTSALTSALASLLALSLPLVLSSVLTLGLVFALTPAETFPLPVPAAPAPVVTPAFVVTPALALAAALVVVAAPPLPLFLSFPSPSPPAPPPIWWSVTTGLWSLRCTTTEALVLSVALPWSWESAANAGDVRATKRTTPAPSTTEYTAPRLSNDGRQVMKSPNVSKKAHLHADMSSCLAAILDTDPEALFCAARGYVAERPAQRSIGNA